AVCGERRAIRADDFVGTVVVQIGDFTLVRVVLAGDILGEGTGLPATEHHRAVDRLILGPNRVQRGARLGGGQGVRILISGINIVEASVRADFFDDRVPVVLGKDGHQRYAELPLTQARDVGEEV